MTYSLNETEDLTLPLPITQAARNTAQQFADQQPTPQKAQQVRLNTLAVWVVHDYLQMMGLCPDLAASDSWNPVMRLSADIADLEVPGRGRLECRPIKAHELACTIPPEAWSDRIGYLVVRIDESLREATLLGFTQTAAMDVFPISQLQPLETLLDHLSLGQPVASDQIEQSGAPARTSVNLSQWWENLFETGWQTVEALLHPSPANLAFSFRGADSASDDPDRAELGIRMAKLIDLGGPLAGQPVALIVELRPEAASV
ncbi:MAG TPA: DUF1822 family protein, partial [Candidatus Caenarcaniphilales bacterium]